MKCTHAWCENPARFYGVLDTVVIFLCVPHAKEFVLETDEKVKVLDVRRKREAASED